MSAFSDMLNNRLLILNSFVGCEGCEELLMFRNKHILYYKWDT